MKLYQAEKAPYIQFNVFWGIWKIDKKKKKASYYFACFGIYKLNGYGDFVATISYYNDNMSNYKN